MSTDIVYIIVFMVVCLLCTSINADCSGLSTQEQKYLSLLDPIKDQQLKIEDTSTNFTYTIGICNEVKKDVGHNIGCYQSEKGTSSGKTVGLINKADIKAGTDWILLTYMGGDPYGNHCDKEERRAVIMLICDPDHIIGKYSVIAENTDKYLECYYLFEISTSAACSSSSVGGVMNISGHGISVGSIISIIFFTLVSLYVIVGVLYQRCVVGAKGMEQIPHLTFWRELGNLIADGADFIFRTKPPAEPRSYKGIGDDQLDAMDDDDDRDDHLLPMY